MTMNNESEIARLVAGTGLLFTQRGELDTIGRHFLRNVSIALGCQYATYWQVEGPILRAAINWHDNSVNPEALQNDNRFRTLPSSGGTATHVRRTGIPIWTHDLARDMCSPRSFEAQEAGLTAGIWIPLKAQGQVVAVLELLSRQLCETPMQDRLDKLAWLGEELGKQIALGHYVFGSDTSI